MSVANTTVNRYGLLDTIKGLMIVFIIITHYKFAYPEDYLKYGFVFTIDMAVPVFMVISGYLSAVSFRKKNITTYSEAVSLKSVVPKLLRFFIPFSMAFAVESPILIFANREGFVSILEKFFRGGDGPGSYYTPILMQLIFTVPVVYFIVKKHDFFGVVLCFLFTALWEVIQYSWQVNDHVYALLIFRYISLLAFGSYIAVSKTEINRLVLTIMFLFGVAWQAALNYIPLRPVFMNAAWARVNYLSSMFVLPVMYVLIKQYVCSCPGIGILRELGKASYNIYLVQMVFYGCGGARAVYRIVPGTLLQIVVCIFVCCAAGYAFYHIEHRITEKIIRFTRQQNCFEDKILALQTFCNSFAVTKKGRESL